MVAVLSDINMPGMDGLELLGEIKQRRPELPVMMVTAYGDDERRRRARELGALDFVGEVLIDGLHHSLEHLALEQTLYALHMLTHDYSTDPTVKNLVDTRRIWIVFAVNPDGLDYDLSAAARFTNGARTASPPLAHPRSAPTSTATTPTTGAAAAAPRARPPPGTTAGRRRSARRRRPPSATSC